MRVQGGVGAMGSWGEGNAFSLGPSKAAASTGHLGLTPHSIQCFMGREFFKKIMYLK